VIKVKIIQGHVLEALKQIPDNSVDCIVTSPPYWGLRKYPDSANVQWSDGWYGQLGLEPTLEMYIEHLLQITKELKRVLKPSGVMFWNHGDCYGGNMGFTSSTRSDAPCNRGRWQPDAPIKRKLPSKTMALQNFRLALRMVDEQGWILRNVIIWHKCLGGNVSIYAKTGNKIIRTRVKDLARLPLKDLYLPTPCGWKRVLRIEKQPKSTLLTIHLRNGFKIEVTPEHRFLVNGSLVEASRLKKGDKLDHANLPNEIGTPLGTYENGWVVGLWLAEGNYEADRRSIRFSLNAREDNLSKKLKEWCEKFAGKYREYNYGNDKIVVICGEVPYAIIRHYTSKSGAKYKRLSSNAFIENNNFLKGILEGFLAGDGYYDVKNDRYHFRITTNHDLLEDLRVICNRLGYFMRSRLRRATIKKINKTYNTYEIEIRKRRKGHFNQKDDFEILRIIKTKGYSYEIEIEEPHIFILPDGTLTHNSNHLPESVKDRFARAYEPVFMFVKSKKYFFDLDAVREPVKTLKDHSFNIRVREAKKGYFEKLGVRATEEEMQKYDNQGKLIGKYSESWDNVKSDSESELTIGGIGRFFVWQKEKGRISNLLGKNPSDAWGFLDEKSLIWLAGILDSEGSIYASEHDRRNDTERHYKNISYEGYVEIVNTDSRLIEVASKIISRILNKEVTINVRDLESEGYRNVYRITLFGEDASKLCEVLLPYLITKRERAKLLIELQKTKEIRKPFSETPEEIIKKREEIYEKIRFYNQYGEDLNFSPDFWTINTEPFPDVHFATFPTELVRRCIKAGCPENGIVLDPFVGSGTTIKVAIEERRNAIGIEIVPEYVQMAEKRCNLVGNPFIEYEKIVLGDKK
jgi:DNA modification methylase